MEKARMMAPFLFTLLFAVALTASAQQAFGSRRISNVPELSLEQGMIRKSVKAQDGKKVGEIEDVIFTRQGIISLILVDMGGFLGEGVKTVALSPDQIRIDDQDNFLFSGTRSDLEKMPEVGIHAFRRPYRGFYGPCGRGPLGRPDQQRQDCREGGGSQQELQSRPQQISSDFFLGAPVFNQRNKYFGEVEDLVVDLASNRITHAVIEVGGFLGIESKKVLIPFDLLTRVSADYVIYPGSKRQLEQMPAYNREKGGQVTVPKEQQNQRARGQGGGQSQAQSRKNRSQQQ